MYALYQNKGDIGGLKQALEAIVPHAFGDHSHCTETWCGYHKDPTAYRHSELPNGKSLQGDGLRSCLNEIMRKYLTQEMLKKIAPLTSSQKNECANSIIGTKSLKIRYYGGSKSNDIRVAAGVAHVNKGCGYIADVMSDMGLDTGNAGWDGYWLGWMMTK
ncbi:hypothetical protein ACROYT_G013886 [Oculina patagonica]